MRLRIEQLDSHLKKGLAPVCLISGDEPLQCGEAADAVRAAARAQGFEERIVLEHDPQFNWDQLTAEAENLSLFARQRLIELRLSSTKIGAEGSRALCDYLARPPDQTLLLITAPKLDRSQQSSKWVKAIDKAGVWLAVWPVDNRQLPGWIAARMRNRGLNPDREAAALLAERVEGNLLAAVQEIEKLLLLHGAGPVTADQVASAIADSARYDVYGLVDALLLGDLRHGLRMLAGLRAEGTYPSVVLWALAREIRLLATLATQRAQLAQAMTRHGVWAKRKPIVQKGLQRLDARQWRRLLRECARADRMIKGAALGDPWLLLRQIATRMAGGPRLDAWKGAAHGPD